MLITIHGTNSGWWPLKERHYTAWTLKTAHGLYWFDAGDNAGFSACERNLPILNTKAIFLSHPHYDHVGGLPQILWLIFRVKCLRGYEPECNEMKPLFSDTPLKGDFKDPDSALPEIGVYTTRSETVPLIQEFFKYTEADFDLGYPLATHGIKQGVIHDDTVVRVEARPTKHLGMTETGEPLSWAFRIQCEGKTIMYSGDFRYLSDLGDWLEGADLFLFENAHVKAVDICGELKRVNSRFGRLVFMHHTLETLYGKDTVIQEVHRIIPEAEFAQDGMEIEL